MPKNISIVIRSDATQTENFAAGELAAYTGAITDRKIDVVNTSPEDAIYVGSLPDWTPQGEKERMMNELAVLHKDGFIIRSVGDALVIRGKTPRATLYGVYEYLQMLGVRWYFPGEEHEFVPKRREIILKNIDTVETPDMDHRSVVIYFRNTAFSDWIDFAAKAKLSDIHLHSDEGIHQMPDLMADRGLDFGLRKHIFGETYSSNDRSDLEKNKTFLADYIRKLPTRLSEFFLWQADVRLKLRDGEQNERLSLPDAVLLFVNEMAGVVQSLRPAARMSFLAYGSTWGVPESIRPSDGVFLELAPIQRCFSHAITDPACPINSAEILPVIEDLLKIFDPAESHVLGYWLDVSLFRRGRYEALSGRLPQIGEIIKQDVKYYKSKGVSRISTFAVGLDKEYFSRFASPTFFQYPALLWNVEADLKSELIGFCENYYGDSSLVEIFEMNEQIDPRDNDSANWKALMERFSHAESIVREILKITTDDTQILRLDRLIGELEHMRDWIYNVSQDQ